MPRKIIFAALFLALAAASVLVGAYDVPLASPEGAAVFFISRLLRLVSILITGMSLAIAGLIMQQLS